LLAAFVAFSGVRAANNISNTPSPDAHLMPRSSIPVSVHNGFVVVAVGQIGGQKQNFIIDTGTAPSVLNARVARKLALPVTTAKIVAVGKEIKTGQALVHDLALGPVQVPVLQMNVIDLSQWEKNLGIEVAGLLGMDVLSRASFRLDYDKRELQFGDVEDEGVPVGYNNSTGLALADAVLQGKAVRLIVDTGSDLVVVYGENWQSGVPAAPRNASQQGTSVAEQVSARPILQPEMQLGGLQFRGMRTYYVPTGAAAGYDGFFGVRALKLHGISFNRDSQTLYLLN
jgi:predicted aspartyl protease